MADLYDLEAPLNDPAYEPQHPPVLGLVPEVVAKWGPRSQRRWYNRFWNKLHPQKAAYFESYFFWSEEHPGCCCPSCVSEEEYDGWPVYDDHCCCVGYRAATSGRR